MNSASSAAAPSTASRSARARPRTTSPRWPQAEIERTNATDTSALSRPIWAVSKPRSARITEANGPNAAMAMPLRMNSNRIRAIG